jgi:hypothetical protein
LRVRERFELASADFDALDALAGENAHLSDRRDGRAIRGRSNQSDVISSLFALRVVIFWSNHDIVNQKHK